jgi:hypothetical protein
VLQRNANYTHVYNSPFYELWPNFKTTPLGRPGLSEAALLKHVAIKRAADY